MTSVFYDVIRLEAVCGGSNIPIESHFDGFFGDLNPKMSQAIVWTPQKALPYVTTRTLSHCSPKSIHGSLQQASQEKIKIKREALYFTYFARRSLTAVWHKFWVTCLSRGRNQLCKVLAYRNRLRPPRELDCTQGGPRDSQGHDQIVSISHRNLQIRSDFFHEL